MFCPVPRALPNFMCPIPAPVPCTCAQITARVTSALRLYSEPPESAQCLHTAYGPVPCALNSDLQKMPSALRHVPRNLRKLTIVL
jgi:hypothetical protein